MAVSEALDAYLDFLDSSTTTTEKEAQPTPHIDHILHNYQQQRTIQGEKRGVSEDKVGLAEAAAAAVEGGNYEGRLYLLEKQLTDLLQRSKTGSPHKLPERTSDSEENSENSPPPPPSSTSHRRPSNSLNMRQLHSGQRRSAQSTNRHTSSSSSIARRPSPSTRGRGQRSRKTAHWEDRPVAAVVVSSAGEDERRRRRLLTESRQQQQHGSSGAVKKESSSMKVLNEELDGERERRWKAEQAAGRLVEHVRKLQSQLSESQRQREECVVREAKLEQELGEKVEILGTVQKQIEELQNVTERKQAKVEDLKTTESKHLEMLHKLEESCRALECERLRERTELCSRLHDSEVNAAGHQREVETLRRSTKELKRQVHDLQELVANREREHIKEMERSKPLTNQQVDELIRKEVERESSKMAMMLEQQKKLLHDKEKAYLDLEEEFRLALRIEASRYNELQASHQEVVGEVQSSRETAVAAVKKEQKATALVVEMTTIVKELKSRINELSQNKQETVASLKERVGELEEAVSAKNKLEVRVQVLQEENNRLLAQASAQESVIEGLREERKLWGKELAHQGAALAQDRGRMEAQLDTLTKECKALQEQLGRERDAVRIKEKQVEDQLETIHGLKQHLASKEHKFQSSKLEWEREQQSLQLLLEQEEASNNELQEQVTGLVERKEQLKEELSNEQEQLQHWKEKHSKLKSQWDEKLELLSKLEQNMADVQSSFKEKEAILRKERDQAVENARSCEQRLKSCDDAFRHQLEAKQKAHDSHVTKIVADKDQELAQAHQRVLAVEEEMRELLKEMAAEKRKMETKLQKLSQAFQELHAQDA